MIGLDTIKSMYRKVFGTHSDRELKKLHPKLAARALLQPLLRWSSIELMYGMRQSVVGCS